MADNLRHAQYSEAGLQIDDPQRTIDLTQLDLQTLKKTAGSVNGNIAPPSNLSSTVRAAIWPLNDGTGTSLRESTGRGPAIPVVGTTTGVWNNSSYFTHNAAGNTLKLANNSYIDGILDMTESCSVIVGTDFYLTAWPSSTEVLWAMHRTDAVTGGIRMPFVAASAGRMSIFYKPSGGAESELVGYTMSGGTYLNQRVSVLCELKFNTPRTELAVYMYINGRLQRSNVVSSGTVPSTDANGGISFSGYGNPVSQKLNSGGSGARTALSFVMKYNGKDRNVAGRLAQHIYNSRTIPPWLQCV